MHFEQLYSSSSSNLHIVTANNGDRLMIECGTPWRKLQKALNYDLSGIEACLLSHSHADHSKAVKEVMRAGIDVYTSAGTKEACGIVENRRAKTIANKTLLRFKGSFGVLAFDTNHDAEQPLGFIIRDGSEYLLFATDTSHIMQRFKVPFSIVSLECSYDKDILRERVETNDINESLAKRLLTSHQEKRVAMRYLKDFCDLTYCREIHLLHMSRDNIDIEKTRKEFEDEFFIPTKVVHGCQSITDKY